MRDVVFCPSPEPSFLSIQGRGLRQQPEIDLPSRGRLFLIRNTSSTEIGRFDGSAMELQHARALRNVREGFFGDIVF